MIQINQDYYEDLDEKKTEEIIENLLNDKLLEPGSAKKRTSNVSLNGKTTLLEIKN